ncbi:transcriptional regulator [Bacillus phage P59]|jgi:putative transcriptional regulator|nr:transcriptional regulator [Bacillus phage P59]
MPTRIYNFRLKIKEALEKAGMTQKDLARETGLREATISEMSQNARTVINKVHLAKIMDALDITELSDILELNVEEQF